MLLDSALEDAESWVSWLRNKPGNIVVPSIAPVGHLLEFAQPRRLHSVFQAKENAFIYARVGREDAFAFPDLLPGSIVRANTRLVNAMLPTGDGMASRSLFLIEHGFGFCCCRLQAAGRNRFMPLSTQLPYAQVELQLPEEARVFGVLDLEIRSLLKSEQPETPLELARHWKPSALKREDTKLRHMLRNARLRTGLSFREASALSRQIASELGDKQYFASPGSLSDYEAIDGPPRHVHKVITLCAIYGLHFSTFLKSIGLDAEKGGTEPIPDNLVPRNPPTIHRESGTEVDVPAGNGFLEQLVKESEHLPLFLRESLSDLSGLKKHSLHDFFWVGGELNPLHPLLVNGVLVIVNRHRKGPVHSRSKPLWEQPLYILLRRDGKYLCGCCSLENGTLVIHPYPPNYQRSERLRNHIDAEVVGQVVVVTRRF